MAQKLLIVALMLLLNIGYSFGADPLEAYGSGDYATAFREFKIMADEGDSFAQSLIGGMYREGKGVPQNYAEAAKWYRKAADQGSPWGYVGLGTMYAHGEGVPQDYIQAYKWANLAAAFFPKGDIRDQAVKLRDAVEARMTAEQIAEAQKLAREWKPSQR